LRDRVHALIPLFNYYHIMLHFNELYITEDGKNLVVDVEFDDPAAHPGMYIEKIEVALGSDCNDMDPFSNSTVVWEPETFVVGDIDRDGKFTQHDIDLVTAVYYCSSAQIKQSDQEHVTNIANIYKDETGYYYWFNSQKYPLNADRGLRRTADVIGDLTDTEIYNVLTRIVQYSDAIDSNNDALTNLTNGKFLHYLCTGWFEDVYIAVGGKYSGTPYDINGDSEVNVADLNAVTNYILSLSTDDDLASVVVKKQHWVHECFSWANGLSAILGVDDKDLSGKLFFVRVYVNGETEDIVSLDCATEVPYITGVAFNGKPLYCNAVKLASSFGDSCDDTAANQFVDYILRYYAFDFALRCGDLC